MTESRPRVLLLVENNSYPQDFRVRREAHTLRDAGCAVIVIAPRDRAQRWTDEVDSVRVYRFPAPPSGHGFVSYVLEFGYATFAMLLLTMWVWLVHGIDVIHAANPPDTLFVIGGLFKVIGKRFVFDQHDLAPETYLSRFGKPRTDLKFKVLQLLELCSYSVADIVIVTNQSYREIASTRGCKRREAIFVVRNGPPLSFDRVKSEAALLPSTRHLIGYVGTIGPQDGLDYWVRAIHALVFAFGRRDFTAVVIGSGDALASVRDLAKALNVESYIHFTGRLVEDEVRKYLSAVDVCVQPDPFSPLNDKSTMNKLMEYMALGKPTVAFDLTETRYSAGDAAVYVRPNDVGEFAKEVARLLDNPQDRDRMGAIGRARVRQELAWEYSEIELLHAYAEGLRLKVNRSPRESSPVPSSH